MSRVPRDLVELLEGALQPHLRLLLVRDDVRGLLGEAPVLVLRLPDRLLELDLRVGALFEAAGELGSHVLPPAAQGFEHRASLRARRAAASCGSARFLDTLAERLHVVDELIDVGAEAAEVGHVAGRQRELDGTCDGFVEAGIQHLESGARVGRNLREPLAGRELGLERLDRSIERLVCARRFRR